MALTKTKKRKNRKVYKRKNLPIINKDFIKESNAWIPPLEYEKFMYPSKSWFDIKATHDKPEVPGRIRLGYTKHLRVEQVELKPNPE